MNTKRILNAFLPEWFLIERQISVLGCIATSTMMGWALQNMQQRDVSYRVRPEQGSVGYKNVYAMR